jgi:adenosine deaminase
MIRVMDLTVDDRAVLAALPKVELHLHLDVSISHRVAARLVTGLSPEAYAERLRGPGRYDTLAAFLANTRTQVELLQTPAALELLTEDLISGLAVEGVVHAEIRFAPLLHTEQGMAPEDAVEAVLEAVHAATAGAEIGIGVILCTLRHFTAEESIRTARLAARFHGQGVVGFDLAGDEAGFPLATHLPAFSIADDAGVPFTVHAGEGAGTDSVREVLDTLAPPRIGHGVRSIEDPALVERLAAAGTHLEVCPTCNVQLGVFPSLGAHSIDALYRQGVSLGISTDNRTTTPTTLLDEYTAVATTFGWQPADFTAVNEMAAAVIFAPDDDRKGLVDRIRSGG